MRHALAVAALLVLAGCSGANAPADPVATSTDATDTPTRTVPAGVTAENTVDYTALSPTEQRAFDTAVTDEAGFGPERVRESSYVESTYYPTDAADVFQNHEYVHKNGSHYRLSWDTSPLLPSYRIRTTEREPPENATVIALSELPASVREPVRSAAENGSYDVPVGKWSARPDAIDGVDYVRAENSHYRLTVDHGDYWADVLHAAEVKR
jgi:hypothetical protein